MSFSWIPNAISVLRIALIAPILWLILNDGFGLAVVLFCLAGFSDGVDGYLAKRFDWRTRIGALLDPIADKLLVAGMFVTLAYMQHIPVWLASVVILRGAGRAHTHQQTQYGPRTFVLAVRNEPRGFRVAG